MRLLLLLLLLAPSVWGQVNDRRRAESGVYSAKTRIESQMEACPWKWGSAFVTPNIGIAQLGYDSNIYSVEENEESDFTVLPQIGLQSFWRMSPRFVWMNRADYQYRFFRDASDLNGSEYDVSSRFHALFQRVYFSLGGDYREDRQRVNSEIDLRAKNETTEGSGELVLQVFNRTFIEISGRSGRTEFNQDTPEEEELYSNLTRDFSSVSFQTLYQYGPQFWPFFGITSETFDFEDQGNPRNSTFSEGFVGFRSEYDRRLHFNVKIGMTRMEFDLVPEADDDVFATESLVRYRLSRLSSIDADIRRVPIFSTYSSYNYYVSTRYSAGYTYQIKGGWGIGPEIQLGTNEYDSPLDPEDPSRTDDFSSFNFRITIPSHVAMEFALRFGYTKRKSEIPGQSDEGFQVTSTIRYRN